MKTNTEQLIRRNELLNKFEDLSIEETQELIDINNKIIPIKADRDNIDKAISWRKQWNNYNN